MRYTYYQVFVDIVVLITAWSFIIFLGCIYCALIYNRYATGYYVR